MARRCSGSERRCTYDITGTNVRNVVCRVCGRCCEVGRVLEEKVGMMRGAVEGEA